MYDHAWTLDQIRGVVLTLETLTTEPEDNRNGFSTLIIEGKPIQYWIGFISGYMLGTIELNYPEALNEVLNEAPSLKHEFKDQKKKTLRGNCNGESD